MLQLVEIQSAKRVEVEKALDAEKKAFETTKQKYERDIEDLTASHEGDLAKLQEKLDSVVKENSERGESANSEVAALQRQLKEKNDTILKLREDIVQIKKDATSMVQNGVARS